MSYEKFYPGGWQSGESGGTPITPEALNHIENGIKQTYSDFAPAGYGLGDVAPTLWSGSVTDITKSGWYWYQDSTASGGPYHEGVILASIGPYHSRLDFFALHGNEYNGCHAVRVKNWNGWQEWEWENPPMVENVEYRTTERIDGKAVYKKKSGGFIYYRLEGDEVAMTPTVWMDGIFNRINGVNMRSLYFAENTTTRVQFYGRGAYLVGVTFNGGHSALYTIHANASDQPISRIHKIDGGGDLELGFVLDTSNGELEITCPQQWCYGFIIGSGASIGWV